MNQQSLERDEEKGVEESTPQESNLIPGLDPAVLAAKLNKRLPLIKAAEEHREQIRRQAPEDIDTYGFSN